MTLRIESAAGFQGGALNTGNANVKGEHYSKPDAAATNAPASDAKAAPPAPNIVNAVADKSVNEYPKLVGPEAPASLLFEASLAASAKQRGDGESHGAHIDFPRMINRQWVPSPSEMNMLEQLK